MDAARRNRDAAIASEAAAVAAAAAAVAALEHERSVGPQHYLVLPPGNPSLGFPKCCPHRRPFPHSTQNTDVIPVPYSCDACEMLYEDTFMRSGARRAAASLEIDSRHPDGRDGG